MLPLLSSVWRQLIFRSAFHRTWWTAKRWYHYWPKDSRWPKPQSVQSRSESGKGGLLTFFTCRSSFNHVHLHHGRPLQTAVNYSLLFLAYFICFGKHSFPTRAAPPGIRIHTLALRSCVIFYSIITASGYDSRLPCSSTVLRCIIACQALLKVLFCILHSGQVTTCCDIPQGIIKGAIN